MGPTYFYQDQFLPAGRRKQKIYSSDRSKFFKGELFENSSSGVSAEMMNGLKVPTQEEIALRQISFAKQAFAPNAIAKKFLNYFPDGKIDLSAISEVFSGTSLNLQEILTKIDNVLNFSSYNYNRISKKTGKNLSSKRAGVSLLTENVVRFSDNVTAYKDLQLAFTDLINLLHSVLNNSNGSIILNTDIQREIKALDKAQQELNTALIFYEVYGQTPTNMTSFNYKALKSSVNKLKGAFLEDNVLDFINMVIPNILPGQNVRAINTSQIRVKGKKRGAHQIGGGADGIFIDMDTPGIFNTPLPFNYTIGGMPGTAKTIGDFLEEVDKSNGKNMTIVIDDEDSYFDIIKKYGNGLNIKSGWRQSLINKERSKISINELPNTTYTKVLKLLTDWYGYGHIYSSLEPYNLFFDYNLIHLMTYWLGKGNSLVAVRDGIMPLTDYLEKEWKDRRAYIKAREAIRLSSGLDNKYQVSAVSSAKIKYSK